MAEREHFTNGRCFAGGSGLTFLIAAFGAQIAGWQHWITIGMAYGLGIVLMFGAIVLITKSYYGQPAKATTPVPQSSVGIVPGIPSVSSLLGQNGTVDFDAKKFFAQAHYSPVTAEMEKNIKLIAEQSFPNDKEAFYARLIGVGLVAIQYDYSFLLIFGSQLKAMAEMNSRGLIPLADLKKHYDKAAADYPKTYTTYTFDQWIAFMKSRLLIAMYPSQMVELSWMGKDFLKYIAHAALDTSKKLN